MLDPAARDDEMVAALRRMGLVDADEQPVLVPLTGGVSSEILRADTRLGPVCVKRALARLRVDAVWEAPVSRNLYERRWLELAGEVTPGAVPEILGHDDDAGAFAMTYLDPSAHPVWKRELLDGNADAAFAAAVGDRVGAVHAATAGRPELAERFPTEALFAALRLEPYLGATAAAHPDLAARLHELAERTAMTKLALVHGDVSPKNVLRGPRGPILLDAECATIADPAFDVAFCSTHLLLKCLWRSDLADAYLTCLGAFAAAHARHVDWEEPATLEMRAAELLPAIALARIDGKSPVEYLDDAQRSRARAASRALLHPPYATTLAGIGERWSTLTGSTA